MKIKTQFKTMTTPLLNIETAIANIEETLEALTVPYSVELYSCSYLFYKSLYGVVQVSVQTVGHPVV
jgi:hypothetical protein